ncbi:MAG: rhomboid family intramembrane serine protease [Acidobacteriota bacterium]
MSLQYEKEQSQTPNENGENLQTATAVLPIYSIILVVCLIAVSLCQFWVDGEGGILLGGGKSIILAGFDKSLFFAGQYWRILTGATLHGGLVHLAFNCYALYVLGKLIEVLSNRAHLAIVFLLSVIGGGVLSLIFLPDVPSVGASGGIVGFLGYLAVYGFRRRQLLTNAFLKNMLFNIGFIALYGYFLREYIDNFGHLGGLLVGAVYGFFQISGDVYKDPREVGKTTEFLGLIALGIFIATSLFSILVILGIV